MQLIQRKNYLQKYGIACNARFVNNVPYGYGKIPVPEDDAWEMNCSKGYKDFKGNDHVI